MSEITVLHVDDDSRLGDLVAEFLERENTRFTVVTETSASDGLERIEAEMPDCVISDYDMPDQNGLDFLNAVRDAYPDLPFILFTGKGSEEVASEALSAGATDYLQKASGTNQYTILANRVKNAVEQYRSQKQLKRERSRMKFALQSTKAAIWTRDIRTDEMDIYPEICPVFNEAIKSLDDWLAQIHPEDRSNAEQTIRGAARSGESYSLQFRFDSNTGTRWGEMNGQTIKRDGNVSLQTGITRDITEQKEQKRRFETLTSNLPGMVYRCKNAPSWPMKDVRGNVAGFSGYTATELESNATQWGEEVVHPDDQDMVWDTVQESLETSESFEITYRIRTKNGETRWVWERGRGVYGPDGDVQALEGFVTDITNRKQQRDELQ
ncbi:PAS domain S-box-containing protein [Halobiforma haloterrestris]|uniref:histidine kinase n=1 Tax=Natronobacterium haloterrestre TaxID=148448 RepID=A0A1I1LTJ9_NATHA|nr:PAS domain-containing protein [Halobiforma haloterrestris]SFC76411.1 PAS domain S-box-containing protein [Halobiforma haloterrestris]